MVSLENYSKQVYNWASVPIENKRLEMVRALMGLVAELDEYYDSVKNNLPQEEIMSEASDCIFWFTQLGNIDERIKGIIDMKSTEQIPDSLDKDFVVYVGDTAEKLSRKDTWDNHIIDKLIKELGKHFFGILNFTNKDYEFLYNLNYRKLSTRRKPGKDIKINFL